MFPYLIFASVEHEPPANPVFALFADNTINWVVLALLVVYFMFRNLPPMFRKREDSITSAIEAANAARAEGESFLASQKEKIANAEKEAESILVDARAMAEQMKAQIERETEAEIAALSRKIEQQVAGERQIAITELRRTASRAAIALAEASLPGALTDAAKDRLMTDFTNQLEAVGK